MVFLLLPRILVLSTIISCALSATITIQIPYSNLLPNPNTLSCSTHAILTSGSSGVARASLRRDNTIVFSDISTTGSQLLSIYSASHTFAPYRVDISPTNSSIIGIYEHYPGSPWSNAGPQLISSPTSDATFTAKCLSSKTFYEERPGFSPLSLLKNPMILLAIVALAFTFGMPKMMENMDPEMRAEYEEMQKKNPVGGITRAIQEGGTSGGAGGSSFDLAGWMAGQHAKKNDAWGAPGGRATGVEGNNIRERRR